jgi:putative transposase
VTIELVDEAVASGARVETACDAIGLCARTLKRWRAENGGLDRRRGPSKAPEHKLRPKEREAVLAAANEPRFRNLSPKQIVPLMIAEDRYLASESTFYRVLHEAGQMAHRGPTRAPQRRPRPEHIATAPRQLWSWDITYLRASIRGLFYYLYAVVDVWSRKIVGYAVHEDEGGEQASALLEDACKNERVERGTLVLHADNGGPMKGATLLSTLQRLGVAASFSRPRVSDDNPYSEALFRTLKYRPDFPRRPFRSLEEARAWAARFVAWYNSEHLHSALRFVTPNDRHDGREKAVLTHRQRVLVRARKRTPRRWTGQVRNCTPVATVALNPIRETSQTRTLAREV